MSGSVSIDQRPSGRRIYDVIQARRPGVDAVIVTTTDRLGRDSEDTIAVINQLSPKTNGRARNHVGLVAIDQHIDLTGPFSAFIAKQFVLFSELELALIRQRTSNALQHKRRTGLRNTHSLFGYDAVDGQWIPNDDEQATIRRIHELHAAGHTDSTITRQFNTDGTPAKRGGRWQANTVYRIRTRELQLQSV